MDFHDQVAIITGGSRGIGFGIAQEFVSRAGRVVLTAREPKELDAAVASLDPDATGRVVAVRGRADDEAHQAGTVALAIERFGRIDHLVANAGVSPHYGPMMEAELAAVRTAFEVNVTAVLGWTQQVWRASMAEHGGSVLNVASISGLRAGAPIGAYITSKAALLLLTQQLAVELAPRVRVNAIAPGIVKTRFSAAFWEGREDDVAAGHPLRRLGTSEDIARAACFLLSDDASWITGETLVIDGGLLAGK